MSLGTHCAQVIVWTNCTERRSDPRLPSTFPGGAHGPVFLLFKAVAFRLVLAPRSPRTSIDKAEETQTLQAGLGDFGRSAGAGDFEQGRPGHLDHAEQCERGAADFFQW